MLALALAFDGLQDAGTLLTLGIVILAGMLFGGAARRARLPSITGQILAGVLLGHSGLDLFHEEPLAALQPITHFALGLMAVTVGAHLNLRRLRNAGKRLFYLLIAEATITPLLVFVFVVGLGDVRITTGALLATCAIATAPATIVALVKEARAKGVFVKTLVAAVAFNNMSCMFLFEVARAFTRAAPGEETPFLETLRGPLSQLVWALAIGGGLALAMEVVSRTALKRERMATASILAIVLCSGTASILDVSPLLACLFLGLAQTNLSRTRERVVDSVFSDFQPVILAVFFTLAGMHLSFDHAAQAGMVAVLMFLGRFSGKLLSADVAMRLAHATDNVRKNLGMALVPQAGVAVALVILVQDDPAFASIADLFSAVVLTVVTTNEIVGPLLTRSALRRSGEAGMDRLRLMDFLQEENIVTDFRASTKEEAIERLVDLFVASHPLQGVDRDALLASVLAREAEASTCFGGGLAVPHGILPDGLSMAGVLGISRDGLSFETPDGHAVHCMVLLGTSREERDRHLQVLAALARTIGSDPVFRDQLIAAKSPAHASELLHGEESEDFNVFLDEDD